MDEASRPVQYDNEKLAPPSESRAYSSYQPQPPYSPFPSQEGQLQQPQQQHLSYPLQQQQDLEQQYSTYQPKQQDIQQQKQQQQQQQLRIYQEEQEEQEEQTPLGPPIHRSKTCPVPDHNIVALGNYGEPPPNQFHPPLPPRLDGRCCTTHEQDEERLLADATCLKRTRYRIGKAIESKAAHIAILVLTLCDIILVMLQIGASLLHLDETEHEHWVLSLFEHLSLTIISVFMLEILLKVFAFGPRYFWIGTRHWVLHLVDATIIVTSFMLEIFLKGAEQELSSLLIVFRLWRVVKLTGTVAVEVSEHGEAHVALLEERVHTLELELEESRLKIQRLEGFNVPRV